MPPKNVIGLLLRRNARRPSRISLKNILFATRKRRVFIQHYTDECRANISQDNKLTKTTAASMPMYSSEASQPPLTLNMRSARMARPAAGRQPQSSPHRVLQVDQLQVGLVQLCVGQGLLCLQQQLVGGKAGEISYFVLQSTKHADTQ